MRFQKVIVDGKEYYEMIEDAPETENAGSSEEKNESAPKTPYDAERLRRDAEAFAHKVGEFAGQVGRGAADFAKKAADGVKEAFGKDKSADPSSKTARLLALLPFMEDEDIHALVEKILSDADGLSDVDLLAVLPFLSDEDCDALFLRALEKNVPADPAAVAPFVSEECLTKIVDRYLAGELPSLNIDALYPFLPPEDIKRIFRHIMEEPEKGV